MRTTAAYAFTGTGLIDEQLAALTDALDPYTRASLTEAGLAPGWQVLDVGAGSGTIASWLAEQVGPAGHVTATDLDTTRIPEHRGLTATVHDLTRDQLPEAAYDLAHARLVLIHLPQREQILARLAAALKPGGMLVLHEFDCTWPRPVHTGTPEDAALFAAVVAAVNRLLTTAGARLDWGIAAHRAMTSVGLQQVTTRLHAESFRGGDPWARLAAVNAVQLREPLLDLGLTRQQLDHYQHLMADPSFEATSYLVTRTVGHRPS